MRKWLAMLRVEKATEAMFEDIHRDLLVPYFNNPSITRDMWHTIFATPWTRSEKYSGFALLDGSRVAGFVGTIFADVEVDLAARTVHRAGDGVEMSPLEFELLSFLLLHRGIAVSREQLLQEVWGYSEPERIRTRTVDTHVAALRSKLERDPSAPEHILTVRKVGYRLEG